MTIIEVVLSFLVGLAANGATNAVVAQRRRKLDEVLSGEDLLRKALPFGRSIRGEVRAACIELAQNRARLHISRQEKLLWPLMADERFQDDLTEWLKAGAIKEGDAVRERLIQSMEQVLANAGRASSEQIEFLKTGYFEALERTVFSNPVLAHWRHQLSLDYLRDQVTDLRRQAEEAAGIYSLEKREIALERYCEKALAAWDIIDLSNLPEGDIHIATQKLLLRQLYMPLRISVEAGSRDDGDDATLTRLEEERETRRRWEAGYLAQQEIDSLFRAKKRSSVGERLGIARRLVVLGDPGGGKTTMLRWMATAYLLRHRQDSAFSQLPDTKTLPNQRWIPVFIRCRDLGEADLCRCFTDFLTQHLRKSELLPEEADVMRAVILDRIAEGEALLLVDGLDEITDPQVRMMFCQELERTAARYPAAPIVVTSRSVGYRNMPYRMGVGFEHGLVAELAREDKDHFARRWVEVTEQHQLSAEREKRARELIEALHSNDRIERLTGNPMLLTTLALVKRKVGKLPSRRTKLYAEAVSVLLNWNPRYYQVIEEDEAIPQLEYLAYEMCRRGVQRLAEDEILDLLDKIRLEYPNVRAIRRREPQVFLELLEARSSILIKSGGIWSANQCKERPVWEFRHLTFQEYLAARALLDGRYPNRDKTKSLAEQVAPLAGTVKESNPGKTNIINPTIIYNYNNLNRAYSKLINPIYKNYFELNPIYKKISELEELEVTESWRETLRLLVADCKDDDVDDVLLAILNPQSDEDATEISRPRAVLAALCLADEPNVSENIAQCILIAFTKQVDKFDSDIMIPSTRSPLLRQTAKEIGRSIWASQLKAYLIEEYKKRPPSLQDCICNLWAMTEIISIYRLNTDKEAWLLELVQRLRSDDSYEALFAAWVVQEVVAEFVFSNRMFQVPGLIEALLKFLESGQPHCRVAACALSRLSTAINSYK